MKLIYLALAALMLIVGVGCRPSAAESGLTGFSGAEPWDLSGEWEYRLGRHAPGNSAQAQATQGDPGEWRRVRLPATLSAALPELKQYRGWLTLRRALPSELANRAPDAPALALYAGRWCDVSVFYLGERQVARIGALEPYRSGCDNAALVELPRDAPLSETTELYVEVYSPGNFGFWAGGVMELGEASVVSKRFYHRETTQLLLIGAYVLVGFYHLLLLFKRRQDLQNLYFGLFCTAASAYWFLRTDSRQFVFGEQAELRMRLEYIALFSVLPPLLLFLSHFFYKKHSRAGVGVAAICAIFIGLAAFAPPAHLPGILLGWQLFALLAGPYAIFVILRESWRGDRDARYLAAGCGLTVLAALHDIVSALGLVNTPHLAAYAFTLFMLSIALVLANRFMRVHNRMEELNATLESEVRERTRELAHTLDAVQALKVRQDADYFLTSLILRPLNGVFVSSEAAGVQALLRPQKTFVHREREHSIGGDFVFADRLELNGTDYIFAVNGDAMGKSMQGAGGALVLGTVTRSLITRTRSVKQSRRTFPEQWLRNYILELQSVFAAFEGAMTATVWAGLLDESSGVLYYVNAAHPRAALYDGEQARFLEAAVHSPSIGAEGLVQIIRIETARLAPGDVVIAGSDGRDDLVVEALQPGERRFNSDDELFLRNVEASDADLDRLEAALRGVGELTDDLSLLRLEFRGTLALATDAINELEAAGVPADRRAASRVIRQRMQGGEYAAAVRLAVAAARLYPEDSELIYLAACALKCNGDFERAVDFGERLRLRDPDHVRNTLNLADAYRLSGLRERAAETLESLNPDGRTHAAFARLQSMLARTAPAPELAAAERNSSGSEYAALLRTGESI